MKILIIINNFGVGGAEHHVMGRINEMYKMGLDVRLITLSNEPQKSFISKLNLPKNHFIFQKVNSPWNLKDIYNLAIKISSISPDVTITHLWFANTVGRIASFIAGVPKIISSEHNISIEKSWKQMFVDLILQFTSHKIIADSETSKKSLINYGILKNKIEVLHPSIDLDEFNNVKEYEIREKYGIPKNEFIFLFAGSLCYQKNVFNIIKAFSFIKEGVLIIAGDGKDRKSLELLVKELNLDSRVFFVGVVYDLALFMRQSDCFVFPTRWEGFGLVVAEAILSKLPVIISRDSACAEMVTDGVNGLVVDNPEDPYSISKIMFKIINEDNLLNRLKNNCGFLPFDLSIEYNINQLLRIIKS